MGNPEAKAAAKLNKEMRQERRRNGKRIRSKTKLQNVWKRMGSKNPDA